MGIRTVRLDEESEKILEQIRLSTGLSVSAALKNGLLTLRKELTHRAQRKPYDVYQTLDLGPGGYAIAPSTQTRNGMREALRRKHHR